MSQSSLLYSRRSNVVERLYRSGLLARLGNENFNTGHTVAGFVGMPNLSKIRHSAFLYQEKFSGVSKLNSLRVFIR